MWVAKRAFTGVVAGAEKAFAAGATIPEADAKELGLKHKPDLAKVQKVKDADGSPTENA